MLDDVLLYLLNHDLQRVKRLACCVVMEIKLLVLDLSLEITFVNLLHVAV